MENLTRTQIVLLVLLVSFVTSLATGIVTVTLVNQAPPPITHTISKVVEKAIPTEVKSKTIVINPEDRVIKAIKDVSPAVVSIMNTKKQISGGAGFFISKDGMVLTNKHIVEDVVEDAGAEYTIVTGDGKIFPAKVLFRNPFQDLAILKADGSNFSFIPLGDSKNINIGQSVIAVGIAPEENQNTVSVGVVSKLNKKITAYGSAEGSVYVAVSGPENLDGLIQTSASIGLGDSGGPLIDLSGKVIGVNTVSAKGENVGFALPIEIAKRDIANIAKQ